MKDEIIKTVNELAKILDQCLLGDEITLSINRMKPLLDYITNLQEELKSANESITWWHNRFNAVKKQNNRLQGENQDIKDTLQDKLDYIGHLKELCDKYEEEHNTEFKIWKDERCQLLDYKLRNKKAIEYIEERKNLNWYADGVFVYELLNILNGDKNNNNK